MRLIIVEGPTSTGKSKVARELSKRLGIPAYLKDDYKEREFDKLGRCPDLGELRRIEAESWREVFKAIRTSAAAGQPLIVEGNFFPTQRRQFVQSAGRNAEIIEVYCHATGRTILRRYIKRYSGGERHPSHRDNLWYGLVALQSLIIWAEYYYRPLRLTKKIIRVNTSDFKKVDYDAIARQVG